MQQKKTIKRIILLLLVLILLWGGAFVTDYLRVTSLDKRPLFCMQTDENCYTGLGWQVEICPHPITGKEEYCFSLFGKYIESNITN